VVAVAVEVVVVAGTVVVVDVVVVVPGVVPGVVVSATRVAGGAVVGALGAAGTVEAGASTGLSGSGETRFVGSTNTIDAGGGAVGTCAGRVAMVEPVNSSMRDCALSRSFDSRSSSVRKSDSRADAASVRSRSWDSRSDERMFKIDAPIPAVAVTTAPTRIAYAGLSGGRSFFGGCSGCSGSTGAS
jgi:hypothetical protein